MIKEKWRRDYEYVSVSVTKNDRVFVFRQIFCQKNLLKSISQLILNTLPHG